MGRLIVISNRVAVPDVDQAQAGGLAVALNDALSTYGGLWLGWSGRTVEEGATTLPHIVTKGNVAYALLDLTPEDYAEYYNGFANRTLWPLFHYRLDMAEFDRVNYQTYLKVNTFFATALLSLLQPDDIIWVHDYHLIPLGQELRRLGVTQRIGIFMHTPFPALEIMLTLPSHARLVQSMSAYDVVGFQTINDLRSFLDYVTQEANGKVETDGTVFMGKRTVRAAVFAIGLDAESMATEAVHSFHTPSVQRLQRTLHGRALLIGVDRLDYSKGIPERLRAYARFLERHPPFRKKVTFLQISPVSRGDVPEYRRLRRTLEQEAGRINGQYGEPDWVPVRYVSKGYKRATLAGYYRTASVAVITPLRDGMNLVAKEFVVAQNADSPGVLVLSRFAGAAHELDAALLVNPYDVDDVADAMARALSMPLEERIARWRQMQKIITTNTLSHWCENFLTVLRGDESVSQPE